MATATAASQTKSAEPANINTVTQSAESRKITRSLSPPKFPELEGTGKKEEETHECRKRFRLWLSGPLPFLRKEPWEPKNFWEKIFYQGTNHNFVARVLGTTVLCQIVGIMFYFFCALKFAINPRRTGIYVAIGIKAITYFVLLFRTARIIFFVGVPSLLTSKLRTLLILSIVAWAFQYPAVNITSNIRSSVEGIACVQERVRALAEEIRENANKKLQELPVDEAQELIEKATAPFKEMQKTLRKVEETVSTMLEWQRKVTGKISNLFESCSEMTRQPFFVCTRKLSEFYYTCLDNTFEFVCEPILFLKKQCYLTRFLIDFCDWPAAVKKNIKEGVGTYVKDSMHKALELTKNTTFYEIYAKGKDKVKGTKQAYDTLNLTLIHNYSIEHKMNLRMDDFRKILRSEVSEFETFLTWVSFICDIIAYPIIALPFFTSVLYIIKFNRTDKSDNYFITEDFLQIDQNREAIHTKKIIPMSVPEQSTYIYASAFRISNKEKLKLFLRIAMTFLGVMVPLIFVCVDILMYTMLDAGYEFFHSNLTQISRPNIYQLKVSGTGFLNSLLSNILEVFQPVNELAKKKDELWRDCFSEPTPPNYTIVRFMIGMFLFAFTLCFVEIYVSRLRHLIAEYYFPQRKRPRALHLYKEILEKRKNILNQTLSLAAEKVERLRTKKAKEKEPNENVKEENEFEVNILPDIKTKQCVRCGRIDLKLTNSSNTRICVNCKTLYCVDCFSIRKKCLDCKWPLQQVAKQTEFYVDSSCSDSE
uniref:Dendritic cell-specific transmembrane protein-like domain-containing protein n=1 Tax=Panagrolaimus sp. ES5 TaxID=591445 RepID=A0AC34GVZ9_9BILA